jgi:stage II sporulation protein GA (sporulation sigma-E factor processing peptidase)
MTVYADVLFTVNFCMDLLSLYGAGVILGRRKRSMPMILAAAIGALYGVLEIVLDIQGWISIMILVGVSLTMCGIAYGCNRFFSTYVVFLGAEAFLGGIMSLLYTAATKLLKDVAFIEQENRKITLGGFVLALLVSVLVGLITQKTLTCAERGVSEIQVAVGGHRLSFSAVCDSGNLLKDPITGTPVILIGETVAGAEWLGGYENPKGYRVIPYESVGGEGLLIGHKPDEVIVHHKGKIYHPSALIAVAKGTRSFDGRGGCIPSVLLRG